MKFKLISENIIKLIEWIGIVGVVVMIAVTFINVIGAKLFLSPLRGATEVVGFGQIVAITFAIAIDMLEKRHITVDFVVERLSSLAQKGINLFIFALELIFFAVLSYKSFIYGISLKRAGEISSGALIPFYPFAFAIAIGAAVTLLFFLNEIITLFTTGRGEKNESS
ncbi:MAG: TRAP transporter small permease [Dethiobacter sp.]|jgi:TRAP-type C4-dicarboxylate transport system permease small subunit|nr:MAG: TRAP transporter small permease [Dethiobacter sp.]